MSDPADPPMDLERWVEISRALASTTDREAVLRAHGLDEDQWAAIDDAWQERVSHELDGMDEEFDGVPELIARFHETWGRVQPAPDDVLSFEKFCEAARAIQRSSDVTNTLRQLGISFQDFTRANGHWAVRIAKDTALAERFRKALE